MSLLLGLLLAILFGLEAFSSAEPPALWVAQSQGIVKIVDGAVVLEIPAPADVQALAVDGKRKRVWAYSGKQLLSYGFDGHPISATTIDPPAGNPVLLAVDARADRVWLAVHSQLMLFDEQGRALWQKRLPNPIAAVTVDTKRSQLWVAHKETLQVHDATGELLATLGTPDIKLFRALAYDARLDQVWVAADDTVRRFAPNGLQVFSAGFTNPAAIAADQDGGVWVSDTRVLAHLGTSGNVQFSAVPGADLLSLAADARDQSAWVASQRHIWHYAADGTLLGEVEPAGLINQLALPAGPIAPQIEITSPASGSALNTSRPTFELRYSGEGVEPQSLVLTADAAPVAVSCATQADMAACALIDALADGTYDIAATIADADGNVSDPALVRVEIDTVPPVITVTSPVDGLLTNVASVRIEGTLSEAAALTINGPSVTVVDRRFAHPATLTEGRNDFALRAVDAAGNVGARAVFVTLDTVPPPAPVSGSITARAGGGQVTISGAAGSVEAGALVTLVNTRTGQRVTVTANADGSFSATLPGEAGDAIQIYATDGATNQGVAASVSAVGGPFSGAITFGTSSPANGVTVDGDRILVSVDLTAPPNTGVTVNDVVAVGVPGASGLRFFAEVPLQTGANVLTVEAHGQDGRVVARTISVTSRGPFPYRVVSDRSAGVSPLKPRLEVWDQSGRGIRQVQVDADNNGSIDMVLNPGDPIELSYSGVGVRQARVVVFDNALTAHTQRVTFVLLDLATVDRNVQAVWGAMNEALVAGDGQQALPYMSADAQRRYAPVFNALSEQLPQIVTGYSQLRPSFVSPDYSEYGVNRVVGGVNRIFLVGFASNQYGQWMLDSM